MSSNTEKIEKLQQQIWDLEAEDAKSRQDKILPFLKEHCELQFSNICKYNIIFKGDSSIRELINLIDPRMMNHASYSLKSIPNGECSVCIDDGESYIRIMFMGMTKDLPQKVPPILKELGLKVLFGDAHAEIGRQITKLNTERERLFLYESLING